MQATKKETTAGGEQLLQVQRAVHQAVQIAAADEKAGSHESTDEEPQELDTTAPC